MRPSSISVALTSLILALSCHASWARPVKAAAPKADTAAIAAAIASPERPAADHERDVWAKPDVVLSLLGARPGLHVIDYFAGEGYDSELLARVIGPKGQVMVYNNGG